MGFFDFFNFNSIEWCDSEDKVRQLISERLTKNNSQWAKIALSEQQKQLEIFIQRFSDRIESFLVEWIGRDAFMNDFAFRMVGRPDISEDLKDKVIKIGVLNNKTVEIDTHQFPDRYKTLVIILYHFCNNASGKTNKNLRGIWADFLVNDLR